MLLEPLNQWVLTELPRLNRSILARAEPPGTLAAEFSQSVLADLPPPEALDPADARRLTVLLGLSGSCVARHFQEEDLSRKARPRESFAALRAGPCGIPFPDYFARLTRTTRTGHPARDCYASLVRWNVPTIEVRIGGGPVVSVLPGCFADLRVRTYTGDPGEVSFFELLKKSEALELAANQALAPIADGDVHILSAEAEQRTRMATALLLDIAHLNHDFAKRPPERGGLRPDHFMDVFRQFAVHWERGDVPPSGAQDPEFLRRDFLLGIAFPDYGTHIRRNFPSMLDEERRTLTALMGRPSLTAALLEVLGLDDAALEAMTREQTRAALRRHPMLGAWYGLLNANAKVGAVHLMLAEKYLFKPQHTRDATGVGDRPLVSNRTGTTGMDEPMLVRLARARQRHALRRLGPPAVRRPDRSLLNAPDLEDTRPGLAADVTLVGSRS
ncbi:hypothetical protein [Actinomadura sp. 6N118]|uniref:hypothetical protein n=1 Tax=Actinomadura sp. 6N118 TaxID=3375151 RepID=UPI003798FE98